MNTAETAGSIHAALREDLRRARIEPFSWVANKSILVAGTCDSLLQGGLGILCTHICSTLSARSQQSSCFETVPIG